MGFVDMRRIDQSRRAWMIKNTAQTRKAVQTFFRFIDFVKWKMEDIDSTIQPHHRHCSISQIARYSAFFAVSFSLASVFSRFLWYKFDYDFIHISALQTFIQQANAKNGKDFPLCCAIHSAIEPQSRKTEFITIIYRDGDMEDPFFGRRAERILNSSSIRRKRRERIS